MDGGADNDLMYGDEGSDEMYGGSGIDTMYGGSGDDTMNGGDGNDEMYGGRGNDTMSGGAGDDDMFGGSGNDTMSGGDSNDVLRGGNGNDTLSGGLGIDVLMGGEGADNFLFDVAAGKANADTIVGFKSGEDKILLDGVIFSALGPSVGKKEFVIGKKALDKNDFLIYNQKSGKLFYDEDGNKGGAGKQLIAKLEKGADLDYTDFLIV